MRIRNEFACLSRLRSQKWDAHDRKGEDCFEIGKRTLCAVSDLFQNVLDGLAIQDLILQLVHPDFNLSGGGGLESDTLGDLATVNARTGMQALAPVRFCMTQGAAGGRYSCRSPKESRRLPIIGSGYSWPFRRSRIT